MMFFTGLQEYLVRKYGARFFAGNLPLLTHKTLRHLTLLIIRKEGDTKMLWYILSRDPKAARGRT